MAESNHVKDVYDILVDILSRLPVKSLLRFRSVCKSWRAMISDPYFVKKHLKHAQTSSNSLKLLYLPNTYYPIDNGVNIRGWLEHDDTNHQYYPVDDISSRYDVIGSCHGLICMLVRYRYDGEYHRDIFIWNPSTRIIKKLPKHDLINYDIAPKFNGFGYDANADDYKVILDVGEETMYGIFSLEKGSWKFVDEDFNFGSVGNRRGRFVNGALHWQRCRLGGSTGIISYDLANAKWEQFCSIRYEVFDGISIGSTRNHLCYWYFEGLNPTVSTLWVMKEYGKDKPWIKLMDIPTKFEGSRIYPSGEPILENGEVLMVKDPNEYVVYNSRENTYRAIPQSPLPPQPVCFLDTLVSPGFGSSNM